MGLERGCKNVSSERNSARKGTGEKRREEGPNRESGSHLKFDMNIQKGTLLLPPPSHPVFSSPLSSSFSPAVAFCFGRPLSPRSHSMAFCKAGALLKTLNSGLVTVSRFAPRYFPRRQRFFFSQKNQSTRRRKFLFVLVNWQTVGSHESFAKRPHGGRTDLGNELSDFFPFGS